MQFIKSSVPKFLVTGFMLLTTPWAMASLVVIGNPNIQTTQLTQAQVSSLYLGHRVKVSRHQVLTAFDQSSNSPLYQEFYQNIVGWNSSQVASYRSSQEFSLQTNVPQEVSNDAAAIATVENTPGAVAYVDSQSLQASDRVKILFGNYTPPPAAPVIANNPYYHSAYSGNVSGNNSNMQMTGAGVKPVASYSQSSQPQYYNANALQQQVESTSQQLAQTSADSNENIWNIIQSQIQLGPEANNARVQAQIRYLMNNPKVFNSIANSATPFIYYVYHQTQLRNMPAIFALLPMIESGYKPNNYSSAGAEGLWQLMPGNASSYGLEIGWWYDGCRDVTASTQAALNFLVLLHQNLGDWDLAAAAYDAGQGAVQAAMNYNRRDGRATDFWDLPLSRETRDYVPELLAFASIVKDPQRYGFTLPNVPNRPFFVAFKMNSQLDMDEIAKLSGAPAPLIHDLNSGMRRFATEPNVTYNLLIPATNATQFSQNLASIEGHSHWSWQFHEVHSGETLPIIAKNYHTNVETIVQANGFTTDMLAPGQDIIVPIWLGKTFRKPLGLVDIASATQPMAPLPSSLMANNSFAANNVTNASSGLIDYINNAQTNAPQVANIEVNTINNSSNNNVSSQPITSSDNLKSIIAKLYGHD